MKQITFKLLYIVAFMGCLLGSSCADDFPRYETDFPEGEGSLVGTVTFTPTVPTSLGGTRTPGDTIKNINSLCVLVYTADGNLFKRYRQSDLADYTPGTYTVSGYDHLDGTDAKPEETTTAKATFTLLGLPFGKYRIYAVANMGDLTAYDDQIQTEDGLKSISLRWNPNNVPSNNQMFGYFTPAGNMESEGFESKELLIFKSSGTKIHAWLKRAASKVTVAFDPSGLNQDVWIYIKNVTIRDIPKTCYLGKENTPTNVDSLYNHLATPYPVPDYTKPSAVEVQNTRFEYNSDGLITDPNVHTGSAKTDGLELTNSIREAIPAEAHDNNAPSLFFYENNQGDKSTRDDKDKFDKRQQHSGTDDGVGTPIRKDTLNNDFKDRVPCGTYIEVEAYYISTNPNKVGEGSIKYRFMLGKDVTYNYDAQRNYHFKVTLGFKGWANDPDWHIDFELPEPGIEVPPVFRVSYLYHQKSELPIRILGDCTSLTVTITENNWAPYDSTALAAPYFVPPAETAFEPDPVYAFRWNRQAYLDSEYRQDGKEDCAFGFLALHLPDRNTTTVSTSFSAEANEDLRNRYRDANEGNRSFTRDELSVGSHPQTNDDDSYEVKKIYDDNNKEVSNQKTLMLPVWTRAKTLIEGSGFSGNNPYEGYERKAVLHIKAIFSDGTEIEKDVTVLQVKRLVNPKGVWREYNRDDAFHVTLLEAASGNDMADFIPFTSQGEWTAFIDAQTDTQNKFSISPSSSTVGYQKGDTIHGYTGSYIDFNINFDVSVGASESQCAIVKVLYHGNQCLHKILVRKGYHAPITMGGKRWSSFSLYQATPTGGTDGVSDTYAAVLTKNPLMLGSMFRRGIQSRGILVRNNMDSVLVNGFGLGPFMAPGNRTFEVARKTNNQSEWDRQTWTQIGFRNDVRTTRTLGTFTAEDGQRYRVPTYQDFKDLTDNAEFGFGVVYGSAATAPKTKANEAYGLIDPNNEGLFNDERGMRGVIVYERTTGNQIFFPIGKYGTGRRNNFILTGNNAGQLRYGDVNYLLTIARNSANLYRPVPYNLMVQSGNIYWIDQYRYPVPDTPPSGPGVTDDDITVYYRGYGCLGWDMNYFNFDFNPYTANNWRDACPIKFILID
ncbi:MAG: hypothetical protein K2H75_09405 [Muribaculaceae bacterium]|nr:hypothetical protein [Muribaculaceae bacterium]